MATSDIAKATITHYCLLKAVKKKTDERTRKNVKIDANLVTADGPNSAEKSAQAIVEALSKNK